MAHIRGYPLVFDSLSVDLGGFIETVRPSAVDTTIRTKHDVVALVNHNRDKVLARRSARTLMLVKDEHGLDTSIMLDSEVTHASDVLRMIQRGDTPGGSFGFRALADAWSLRDGVPFRELLDIVIDEVSVGVGWPAYPGTRLTVGERSQQPHRGTRHMTAREVDTRLRLLR